MKRLYLYFTPLLALALAGCGPVGERSSSISVIYGLAAFLAAVMLVCTFLVRTKKESWFLLLFGSIFLVNCGYFWLSVAPTLSQALWANRLSYLGSVFLSPSMLMIILRTARIPYRKWLPPVLLSLAAVVFAIAATPGWLPIYYKQVELQIIDGVSTLNKVYGPLHCVNLFYLLGYFITTIVFVTYANIKKKLASPGHAVALTAAVITNIGVWFIEQLVRIDFEILSLSYIICEMFLLALQAIMSETEKLKQQIDTKPAAPLENCSADQLKLFQKGMTELTQTEKTVFTCYTQGLSTKEVLAKLNITENTLKFHNKNIYSKLGINSRKQLVELYRHLQQDK